MTTQPGDIVLYKSDTICIHYGSNSWSYTLLARVDGMGADELRAALGTGT